MPLLQPLGRTFLDGLESIGRLSLFALRAILLADSLAQLGSEPGGRSPGQVLARWQPSWLRYSPLTATGLVICETP